MVRRNYDALVSGDGACAGCGEKSILRAVASVTEAYMRPLYHAKADRLRAKADELEKDGVAEARGAQGARARGIRTLPPGGRAPASWASAARTTTTPRRASPARTAPITDEQIVDAHRRRPAAGGVQPQEPAGRSTAACANGMSVMAMAAHTGCNTVYGSTPPNNPHPYPWMNSLFQDGITVGWLLGEASSSITPAARSSPSGSPTRCCTREATSSTPREYYEFTSTSTTR